MSENEHNTHFTESDVSETEEIIWSKQPHYASQIGSVITGLFLLPVGVGVFILIQTYISLNYTSYALTDKALYKKHGWLSDKMQRIPLEHIQNSEYSRSWVEQQFGFGTVEVSSASGSGTELQFRAISEPKKVQQKINRMSSKAKEESQEAIDISSSEKTENKENPQIAKELRETRENLEEIVKLLKENK